MWSSTQRWNGVKETCREHLWVTGEINGRPVAIAVVYLLTGKSDERNLTTFQCLTKDIQDLQNQISILVMGDFNAHVEELDGRMDKYGQRLLSI